MSHLRAPAARADRREGGRHGRPAARTAPATAETHIRPQLLRLAVLPPTAVALSASAAVLFTVRSTGARPSATLWAVLAGAVAVTGVGIVVAAVAADRAARAVSDRVAALRRNSARGEADLRALTEALRRGEAPPQRKARGGPPDDADEFELLAADLARAHDGAVGAVVQASQLSSQTGSEQKLEVFVNLARRLQSLVHREISLLDELENEIEDPALLKGLFHVDHLATRIRRHAENLAVLGGAVSRRQWSNPVSMTEVLRSAIAEVEQYSRVRLVPPIDGELRGHAVADVIHLLAELVENATVFSAPHTQVLLRANLVTSGLAVEVEDRGLGMPVDEQSRMNALLADPDQVNVGRLLADGRIGLFVVSQLARRHGIRVRLQGNIYGGVQAVLVVPQALLGGSAPGQLPGPSAETPAHGVRSASPGTGLDVVPRRGAGVNGTGPGASPAVQERPTLPAPHEPRLPRRDRSATASPATPATQDVPDARVPDGGGPVSGRPAEDGRPGPSDASPEPTRHDPAATHQRGAAPLPVRGAHEERANPAEAVPGIRPGDRAAVEHNAGTVPVPRSGAVRGTMGKPSLPRRRAQEHIVPQLRGGPAPRSDNEEPVGHDPGLMAAFQRGIGLAEAQQSLEAEDLEQGAEESEPLPSWESLERSPYPVSGALEAALRTASNPVVRPRPASETEPEPRTTGPSPAEAHPADRPAGPTDTGSSPETRPAISSWSGTPAGRPADASVTGDPAEARSADRPAGSPWSGTPVDASPAGRPAGSSLAGDSTGAQLAGSSWSGGLAETSLTGPPAGPTGAGSSTEAGPVGSSWSGTPGETSPAGRPAGATPAGDPTAPRLADSISADARSAGRPAGSSWAASPAGTSPAGQPAGQSQAGNSAEALPAHRSADSSWAASPAETPSAGQPAGSSWGGSPGSVSSTGGFADASLTGGSTAVPPPGSPAGTPPAERAASLSSWAVTPAGASLAGSPGSPADAPPADAPVSSPWAGDSARTPATGTGWPVGRSTGTGDRVPATGEDPTPSAASGPHSSLPLRSTPDRPGNPARRPLALGTPAPFTPRLQGSGGEGAGAISEATSPPLAAPGHGAGSDHHTPRHDGSASSG
ncbi:Signal transduction histidine kinase [Streptomyces sp. Amel2xC10]|nr:Signal transduction histidine kinase [Streptomyces sp. Amel2xC10]